MPEIPDCGEWASEDDAMADLREAAAADVEKLGMEDALARMNQPIMLRELDLEFEHPVCASKVTAPVGSGNGAISGGANF